MKDGGSAFPGQQHIERDDKWNQTWDPGMSLLDYATIEFTKAWISVYGNTLEDPEVANDFALRMGRAEADAMIAERGKKNETH